MEANTQRDIVSRQVNILINVYFLKQARGNIFVPHVMLVTYLNLKVDIG